MTLAGIDLFTTAQVVLAATLLVHCCVLRPWNARADLRLTVEMIDKDLTAEIDRGWLPVGDPLVVDLQRCLSLSRKRADAAESISNLTALLSGDPRARPRAGEWLELGLGLGDAGTLGNGPDQWLGAGRAERLNRLDRIDRLVQLTPAEQHLLLEYSAELSAATSAYLRLTRIAGFTRRGTGPAIARNTGPDPSPTLGRKAAVARGPATGRKPVISRSNDIGISRDPGVVSVEIGPTLLVSPRPAVRAQQDGVRHGRRPRGGWPRPRHPRNAPAASTPREQPEERRILDLSTDRSTDLAFDSLYDARSTDRLSLDRASLDRIAHNRLMNDNGPFDNLA